MVFSCVGFIYVFLPAVLLLHAVSPKKLKNTVLLLFDLLFYYVGEQNLVILMIISSLTDYICSLCIEHFRGKKGWTRFFLLLSLTVNLFLLGYFKYADLFLSSFSALTGTYVKLLRVALPIGISFYTFQTMSYTMDVYRGEIKAEKNFLRFATYVTLFPQLVAGPIVRYDTVAKELTDRKVTVPLFSAGAARFCVGLGKKVLIANQLASFVALYDGAANHTVLFAWLTAFAVPLQVYFDFSGYSDMAIGLGRMLGFHFPENFDYPMVSKSAGEFWRRWHITLGSWFRDYLYIPLGGSRVKTGRHILNLLAVWFATGLWHGASYNYILWGLYYAVLLIGEKYLWGRTLEKKPILSRLYFIFITVFGFLIFHTEKMSLLLPRAAELIGLGSLGFADTASLFYIQSILPLFLLALVLSTPIARKLDNLLIHSRSAGVYVYLRYVFCLLILLISTAYLVDGSYNPFLYFRF